MKLEDTPNSTLTTNITHYDLITDELSVETVKQGQFTSFAKDYEIKNEETLNDVSIRTDLLALSKINSGKKEEKVKQPALQSPLSPLASAGLERLREKLSKEKNEVSILKEKKNSSVSKDKEKDVSKLKEEVEEAVDRTLKAQEYLSVVKKISLEKEEEFKEFQKELDELKNDFIVLKKEIEMTEFKEKREFSFCWLILLLSVLVLEFFAVAYILYVYDEIVVDFDEKKREVFGLVGELVPDSLKRVWGDFFIGHLGRSGNRDDYFGLKSFGNFYEGDVVYNGIHPT